MFGGESLGLKASSQSSGYCCSNSWKPPIKMQKKTLVKNPQN